MHPYIQTVYSQSRRGGWGGGGSTAGQRTGRHTWNNIDGVHHSLHVRQVVLGHGELQRCAQREIQLLFGKLLDSGGEVRGKKTAISFLKPTEISSIMCNNNHFHNQKESSVGNVRELQGV